MDSVTKIATWAQIALLLAFIAIGCGDSTESTASNKPAARDGSTPSNDASGPANDAAKPTNDGSTPANDAATPGNDATSNDATSNDATSNDATSNDATSNDGSTSTTDGPAADGCVNGACVDAADGGTCTVAQCDDGEPCNGQETCGASNACTAGQALAEGAACTTAAVSNGACRSNKCVARSCGDSHVDPGEDCDDGNSNELDGCRNNCRFTCGASADCDDHDPCTGTETCGSDHKCAAGAPLDCNDSNACTTDRCVTGTGCSHTLIDGDGDGFPPLTIAGCGTDCNDGVPAIHPGATEVTGDGIDQDCNGGEICFADGDNDGYRTTLTVTSADSDCNDSGEATAADPTDDCNDGVSAINPGVTEVCGNGIDDNCNSQSDELPECFISCDWNGVRWLSHGWDGAASSQTGAWLTCSNGRLSYVQFVLGSAGVSVTPPAAGTGDVLVGCNWGNTARWGSAGFDGAAAFTSGATVTCNGTRVTTINWEGSTPTGGTPTSGNLGCNFSGAVFLSHGLDSGCAFQTGFNVTCNAGRITHFQFVETAGCPRARN